MAARPTLQLVRGRPVLVGDEVRRAVNALVGDGDRGLLVDSTPATTSSSAPPVGAAQTLPF